MKADPFANYFARGATHSIMGRQIFVSPFLDRLHTGTKIEPRPWLFRILIRLVPRRWRPTWYEITGKIEEEQFLLMDNKIVCTPAGLEQLRQQFAKLK